MGYKPAKTIYTLTFTDHPGLEIKMRSTSLGKLQDIMETDRANITRNTEAQSKFFQMIVDLIDEWNFDHPEVETAIAAGSCVNCGVAEDEPMPITAAALKCLDLEMIMELVNAWGTAVMRVSMGKGLNSNGGGRSIPEEAMRMLAEMQNPSTLPEPNFT